MRLPNLIAVFVLLAGSAAEASYVELPLWRGLWIDSAPNFSGLQRQQIRSVTPWFGQQRTFNDGRILINLGRGRGMSVQLDPGAVATANLIHKSQRSATTLQAPSVQAVIRATASVLKFAGPASTSSQIQRQSRRAFVPEPGSLAMVLLGMGVLLRRRA